MDKDINKDCNNIELQHPNRRASRDCSETKQENCSFQTCDGCPLLTFCYPKGEHRNIKLF